MERKQNRNYFLRECMFMAFMQLLQEKSIDDITVTQITERAGVSRMAYYRNYNSKEDIVRDYFSEVSRDFHDGAVAATENEGHITYQNVVYCFSFLLRYGNEISLLLRANLGNIVLEAITKYLMEFFCASSSDVQRKYILHSYAGAIYNTFVVWLKNGAKETPAEMAQVLYTIYREQV